MRETEYSDGKWISRVDIRKYVGRVSNFMKRVNCKSELRLCRCFSGLGLVRSFWCAMFCVGCFCVACLQGVFGVVCLVWRV